MPKAETVKTIILYRIIVNAYKKPDMDGTLFSQSGSWIVGVWDGRSGFDRSDISFDFRSKIFTVQHNYVTIMSRKEML